MALSFPQHYRVLCEGPGGMAATWQTEGPAETPITGAIPPEFGGPGGGFSPEELYALALTNCFTATFKVIAEKSRLSYESIRVEGDLTVDLGEDKRPWMARIDLSATLEGTDDAEKAKRILEKASTSCLILNSVKTAKYFTFTVQ